tara:strand:+ start:995 stop:2368 length:1374 start_codon:yes stop_codon:yes gene_type:complete
MSVSQETLQYAGEYEILESTLTSSTGATVNISKLITEINLFEDLFSNAISGSIILIDSNNLVSKAPLIGQERVKLKLAIPTVTNAEAAIEITFFVYKIVMNTEVSKNAQMIELAMVTPELLKNFRIRVSKSYTNTIDNIVQDILQNDNTLISTKKNVFIDRTSGIRRMVVPNLRPYDIIKNLATEAVSDTGQPYFFFYETLRGLNFVSLETLYREDPIAEYESSDFEVMKTKTPKGKGQSVTGDLEKDYRRTLSHSMSSFNDMLANTVSGMLGSNIIRYDMYHKTYQKKQFGYFSNFDNNARTDGNPIYNSNDLKDSPDARIHLQPGFTKNFDSFHYNNNTTSYSYSGTRIYETLLSRQSKFSELTMGASAMISVHGNFSLNVGKSVNFKMPGVGDTEYDEALSGKYIITTLRHTFNNPQKKSQTIMTLVKDSTSAPFLNITSPEGGVPSTTYEGSF